MMTRVRSALTCASGAIVLAVALAGCSNLEGGESMAEASCVPMTVHINPTPAVIGQDVTLELENVHATCNDTDPEGTALEGTIVVGLRADDRSWASSGLATADVSADLSTSVKVTLPSDTPTGTVFITAYDRDIASIEVVAP
ncbi:hypothetical protein [Demequina aurantiaca]|uniref:hypothetical protein n=1 Tax=Demequina aurantiaca TaxID=676200 RepID=UPI0007857FD4|nr:hypothetical protein [Demequina aurantiaca]